MPSTVRVGCDVGGTFTDFVVADLATGALRHLKVPSTPEAPDHAVVTGLSKIIEAAGVTPEAVESFVHGTTLAVNTILQRAGAPTGLLVTQGFQDVLELARLRLPDPTNYFTQRPAPLVPRQRVREIAERILVNGRVYQPIDPAEVVRAAGALVSDGVEAIAIAFMHAYRNAEHEQLAVKAVREEFPGVFVCASSDVWPQRNEYERTLITVMNAYVGRRLGDYYEGVRDEVATRGVRRSVFSTRSNGGIMTLRSTAETPVATLLSGPASGVMGAVHVARAAGHELLVTFDMGGTSTDVSVVPGEPGYSTESEIGGLPCVMPAIDITSIGAGGGSIGWIDSGVLRVGPRSAGSRPGPACYGNGGTDPTITDAYVTLGIIDPAHFLDGDLALDGSLAVSALTELGAAIGLDAVETAAGVVAVATATMYAEFMPLMASKGVDPKDFTLVAYGGAGPTHAFLLADEAQIGTVLVPTSPGTLCALGCLTMDLKHDVVTTIDGTIDADRVEDLEQRFQELEADAAAWMSAQGAEVEEIRLVRIAEMRYAGQSFEIQVTLPSPLADITEITRRFDDTYRAVYGFTAGGDIPIEVITARVTVFGVRPGIPVTPMPALDSGTVAPAEVRRVYHGGAWLDVGVYRRADLRPGFTTAGPVIVEQYDTTVFVVPGYAIEVDRFGNIIGRQIEGSAR